MRAARKPVMTWSAADLALDGAALRPRGQRVGRHAPPKEGRGEILPGSVKEQAPKRAKVLHEASLL
jgi:electron transfer flavoprotein alpha/beta subunit